MSQGGIDTMKTASLSAIEKAKSHFEKLIRQQLDRIERMKLDEGVLWDQ